MEDKCTLGEYHRICAIGAIPSGEILDAIIALKVMGWWHLSILDTNVQGYRFNAHLPSLGFPPNQREREYKTIGGYAFWTINGAVPVPKYSTEVAAAWKVAEEFCRGEKMGISMLNVVPRRVCLGVLRAMEITEVAIGTAL